ncbi:hypothetical protein B0T24DRAFT_114817 [Lasiosphaeria ovina]|uniref:Uncharacterized protein n=1 Tax=Lasiosphaeria ovina TaxID=92902 RepID=A0AAE0JTF3_9PEZI|nr:hypothetical protein B0T24DRAFT_114817 [Lasiosphaeria ovina]
MVRSAVSPGNYYLHSADCIVVGLPAGRNLQGVSLPGSPLPHADGLSANKVLVVFRLLPPRTFLVLSPDIPGLWRRSIGSLSVQHPLMVSNPNKQQGLMSARSKPSLLPSPMTTQAGVTLRRKRPSEGTQLPSSPVVWLEQYRLRYDGLAHGMSLENWLRLKLLRAAQDVENRESGNFGNMRKLAHVMPNLAVLVDDPLLQMAVSKLALSATLLQPLGLLAASTFLALLQVESKSHPTWL